MEELSQAKGELSRGQNPGRFAKLNCVNPTQIADRQKTLLLRFAIRRFAMFFPLDLPNNRCAEPLLNRAYPQRKGLANPEPVCYNLGPISAR